MNDKRRSNARKEGGEMDARVKELHMNSVVVDGHNHIMMELAKRRNRGDRKVFSQYYAPLIRKSGVNVIMTNIGGDNSCLTNESDLFLWGSLWIVDMLWQEAEESKDTLAVCLDSKDVATAVKEGKIAVLLTMEGGRPLEGKPNLDTLVALRTFYKLGMRGLQLVDNGRNRIGDGKGESRTHGGLTNFGIAVVKEMNRLGMVIDVAHLTEEGFWDVLETSDDPVIDSHSNARSICDHPRNLSDEQIKALAKKGGVVGISAHTAMVKESQDNCTVDDIISHIDYIRGLVGIEHVGIGPDHTEFEMDINIWTPAPGWLEGVFYGIRDSYFVEGLKDITQFPKYTEALLRHGYSDTEIKKILGENWLRVYQRVLG